MPRPRTLTPDPRSLVDGVLVVDKTEGPTSHDVVTFARRSLGVSRIGHTGTLDPMATGVLPLVVGRATRLAQFLTASDKSYQATIAFGRATDTHDAAGKITSSSDRRPTRDELDAALNRFRGTFDQTPPIFSAKNIDGERSYDLARRGKADTMTRAKAVAVSVKRLDVLSFDGEAVRLDLQVSAGFYVRALAHDLGDALGCGGVLVGLRRTRSGEFGLDRAVPLAEVLQSGREALAERLVPFRELLPDVPSVTLRSTLQLERLKNGVEMGPNDLVTPFAFPDSPRAPEVPDSPMAPEAPKVIVRVMGPEGDLVGLARPAKTPGYLHGWVVLG